MKLDLSIPLLVVLPLVLLLLTLVLYRIRRNRARKPSEQARVSVRHNTPSITAPGLTTVTLQPRSRLASSTIEVSIPIETNGAPTTPAPAPRAPRISRDGFKWTVDASAYIFAGGSHKVSWGAKGLVESAPHTLRECVPISPTLRARANTTASIGSTAVPAAGPPVVEAGLQQDACKYDLKQSNLDSSRCRLCSSFLSLLWQCVCCCIPRLVWASGETVEYSHQDNEAHRHRGDNGLITSVI